jgi:hypothetical protein
MDHLDVVNFASTRKVYCGTTPCAMDNNNGNWRVDVKALQQTLQQIKLRRQKKE